MAKYDRYGAVSRKKPHSLFAPISILLVIVAIIFGMGVFFRIQEIEVRGSDTYTDEEIIEASGIDIGDNLFFIKRMSASSRIFSRLPFVEEAGIERILPNKLVITVYESSALAYVNWEGQKWMMTGNCKLLGSGDDSETAGLIHVLNVIPVNPKAGEIMAVDPSESLKLSYLQTLLHAMEQVDMVRDVKDLDIGNPANPTFRYLDRFTVKMGQNDNTDYKLRMLLSAVMQMESDITGTVDLSEGTSVHVSPD